MSELVLELGVDPGPLVVRLTPGRRFRTSLILKANGVPIPWPEAPTLEFAATNLAAVATLVPDPDEAEADAMAVWTIEPNDTANLVDQSGSHVQLSVDLEDDPWWVGEVECRRRS